MKILISGASGLIGSTLLTRLREKGHKVEALSRRASVEQPSWDIEKGTIDFQTFQPDAVIHLAGESIVGRWTESRKKKILDSRVQGTRLLVSHIVSMETPPKVFLSGSAIGYYGLRGDEKINEDSSPGSGDFLSKVCKAWEAECEPAEQAGIRVVKLRTGVVLTKEGGALAKMLPAFRAGLGGVIGSGNQYMSWVSLEDYLSMVELLLETNLSGPVNMTSPEPLTNKVFTKTLGTFLKRPTFLPLPSFAAKTVFGEMANEMLLKGARVFPKRLLDAGYDFKHRDLRAALESIFESKGKS